MAPPSYFKVVGSILFFLGIVILYWIRRRRFYRRGPAGLQQYTSFEASVFTRLFEGILRLIAWAMIVIGAIALMEVLMIKKH